MSAEETVIVSVSQLMQLINAPWTHALLRLRLLLISVYMLQSLTPKV